MKKTRILPLVLLAATLFGFAGCRKSAEGRVPGEIQADAAESAPIVSEKNSKVFHLRDCLYARNIEMNKVLGYENCGQAHDAGRIPCAYCNPLKDAVRPGPSGPALQEQSPPLVNGE